RSFTRQRARLVQDDKQNEAVEFCVKYFWWAALDCRHACRHALIRSGFADEDVRRYVSRGDSMWSCRERSGVDQALLGIAGRGMGLEPSGSAKWTVAGKIRKRRQITAWHVGSLPHPIRIVLSALPHVGPATCKMSCLHLP